MDNYEKVFNEVGGELKRNLKKGEYLASADGTVVAKKCSTCGIWKKNNLDNFSKNSSTMSGTSARCKACKKEAYRIRYYENGGREEAQKKYRDAMKEKDADQKKGEVLPDGRLLKQNQKKIKYIETEGVITAKECIICGNIKSLETEYTKKKTGFAGVNPQCKACRGPLQAKHNLNYYHKHKPKRNMTKK